MANYLGVDIGGTSCKMAIINEFGDMIKENEVSVNFDHYQTPILDTVIRAVQQFVDGHDEFVCIGVSATGQINDETGVVIGTAGHIDHYVGSRIKERFEQTFHKETYVMNDANCMLLGEVYKGGAIGLKNVIAITLGTGVGGGILVNGEMLTGHIGIAGELGHMSIKADGVACYCGGIGCYEQYASTTALVKKVSQYVGHSVDGRWIFNHMDDENIAKLVDCWLDDIAIGLVSLIHIFNPEKILIGGGVSQQEEYLIKPLRRKVLHHVMPRFQDHLVIEAASLHNHAGIYGAVYLAKIRYQKKKEKE